MNRSETTAGAHREKHEALYYGYLFQHQFNRRRKMKALT